jgi:hypothetical protein
LDLEAGNTDMMTLVILIFLGLYLGPPFLLFRAAVRSERKAVKVIASVLGLTLLLLPIWDVPITSYRFNKLCEEEGGIFVYKRVELGDEFYLKPGELTKKTILRADGGGTLTLVKANGNELIVDKINENYEVTNETDHDATDWPGTVKFTTTVSEDGAPLGKAVSFIGGEGWFIRKINFGPTLSGRRCPDYEWEIDRPSYRERLLYEVFYKG